MADDKLRASAKEQDPHAPAGPTAPKKTGATQAKPATLGSMMATTHSIKNNRSDGKFFLTLPDGKSMEIDLAMFDENELRMLDEIDADDSGEITLKEILKVKKSESYAKREADLMKKVVAGLLIFVITLLAGLLGTSFAAAEMAKEMKSAAGGVMTTVTGDSVKMASSDFAVGKDGTLKTSIAPSGRRLAENETGAVLKTQPSLAKKALASSLPDAFFLALKEITIYSDKGYVLQLSIHGFARIPVLNSRCGNVVHLYTAWNNRITLDSTDLSFDESLSAAFAGAGFTVAMGGTSGRRLQDSHAVDGFFGALQGVAESGGWSCADVPLPTLPETFISSFSYSQPCAAGAPGEVGVCDSKFGGPLPGVATLSAIDALAILGKASQLASTFGAGASATAAKFLQLTVSQLRSPKYDVRRTRLLNHPGQEKVTITDRVTNKAVTFQKLLVGGSNSGADRRFHCNVAPAGAVTLDEAAKAARDPALVANHFELMDIVEEGGVMYRHFRLMTKAVFIAWMSSTSTAKPAADYYEYWDKADTLEPHRILNPDGSVVSYSQTLPNLSDSDAESFIMKTYLKASRLSELFTCTDVESSGRTGVPDVDARGAVPKIGLPSADLSSADLGFYLKLNLDATFEDPESLTGWPTAFRLVDSEAALAPFYGYAMRTRNLVAMPDGCWAACPSAYQDVSDYLKVAGANLCEAPIDALLTCISKHTSPRCAGSEFKKIANTCDPDSPGGRLLSRQMGPELIVKEDGSSELDMGSLHPVDQQEMAELLGFTNVSSGRILFSKEETDGLVGRDEFLEWMGEPKRRLQASMQPGTLFQSQSPPGCDWSGARPCVSGFRVRMEPVGVLAGAVTTNGGSCADYQLSGQFQGYLCVSTSTIARRPGSTCGKPFSVSGSLVMNVRGLGFTTNGVKYIDAATSPTVDLSASVNTGIQTLCTSGSGAVSLGAGASPFDVSFVCSDVCDMGIPDLEVATKELPGKHTLFVKLVYSFVAKDFSFVVGARIKTKTGVSEYSAIVI